MGKKYLTSLLPSLPSSPLLVLAIGKANLSPENSLDGATQGTEWDSKESRVGLRG